jgi:hypothetical protein
MYVTLVGTAHPSACHRVGTQYYSRCSFNVKGARRMFWSKVLGKSWGRAGVMGWYWVIRIELGDLQLICRGPLIFG